MRITAKSNRLDQRSRTGHSIMLLVFTLGFSIIGALGLFSYETTRVNVAHDELRAALEAASLAGAAAMASSDQEDPAVTHDHAAEAARQTFLANSILGVLLGSSPPSMFSTSQTSTAANARASNPAANEATLYIEFLDINGNVQPWNSTNGRILHAIGVFGELPSFGRYVGIGKANVVSEAQARVPKMDIVMCFDVSGSIDDQTKVSFVNRGLSGGAATHTVTRSGSIISCLKPPATGTSVNAEAPKHLDLSDNDVSTPLTLGTHYTDLVVNPDRSNTFVGPYTYTTNGGVDYEFKNIGVVVEASRGNLENDAIFTSSGAKATLLPLGVNYKAGYKAAYDEMAHKLTEPITSARNAAMTFFRIMNNNAEANFGMVTFSEPAPSTTTTRTLEGFAYHGQGLSSSSFGPITTDCIPNTRAFSCTCMGDALGSAVAMLTSGAARPDANKAVIMFTDGQPTCGGGWNSAATTAHDNGIAVYTIGLAQVPNIIPAECDNLNDQAGKTINYTNPLTGSPGSYTPPAGGMAAVAGHGGQFFLVTDSKNLNYVFENIARQLVQLGGG